MISRFSIEKNSDDDAAVNPGLRKLVQALIVIALLAFVAFAAYVLVKSRQVQRYDMRFSEVEIGESKDNVIAIMGAPHRQRRENFYGSARDKAACKVQYVYAVETFFLPISWVVGFDDNEIVVTNFRLD